MKARSKRCVGGQRGEGLERGCDAQVDAVGHAGERPVLAGDRGPLLADVAADQRAVGAEAASDAERRVAGERADLDGVRAPIELARISKKVPWSPPICMPAAPPVRASVAAISRRCTSSGLAECAVM